MATILCRLIVKPEKAQRFEEVLREMVSQTKPNEPGCLRYEYWRAAEPFHYYVLLSFTDTNAFYTHQGSPYHEHFLPELMDMFTQFSMEYVDPVAGGGSELPPTRNDALPASAPAMVREQVAKYPIAMQPWWQPLRGR